MKILFLSFAPLLFTLNGFAQQSSAPAPKALSDLKHHTEAHRVMSTPAASRPHGVSANSTAATLAARQPSPLTALPSFSVTSVSGATQSIASLTPKSATTAAPRWVLIYLRADAPATDALLKSLAAQSGALQQGAQTVLVVLPSGKTGAPALAKLQNTYPLPKATWAHDETHAALTQLKPHGLPAVYALEGMKILWTLHGIPGDASRVTGLAENWLAHPPQPLTTAATMIAAKSASTGESR